MIRATPWEFQFARIIVEKIMPITDAYISTYMTGETPERTEKNYTRAEMSNRASKAYKTERVQKIINALKSNIEIEMGRNMVWDKIKSAETLKKIIDRNEANMKALDEINKAKPQDDKSFSRMVKSSTELSQTTLQAVYELNKMFNIYDTKTDQEKRAKIEFDLDVELNYNDNEMYIEQAKAEYYDTPQQGSILDLLDMPKMITN